MRRLRSPQMRSRASHPAHWFGTCTQLAPETNRRCWAVRGTLSVRTTPRAGGWLLLLLRPLRSPAEGAACAAGGTGGATLSPPAHGVGRCRRQVASPGVGARRPLAPPACRHGRRLRQAADRGSAAPLRRRSLLPPAARWRREGERCGVPAGAPARQRERPARAGSPALASLRPSSCARPRPSAHPARPARKRCCREECARTPAPSTRRRSWRLRARCWPARCPRCHTACLPAAARQDGLQAPTNCYAASPPLFMLEFEDGHGHIID